MFFFTLLPFFWAGWLSSIPFVRYSDHHEIAVSMWQKVIMSRYPPTIDLKEFFLFLFILTSPCID
jgi:hypothetical protein